MKNHLAQLLKAIGLVVLVGFTARNAGGNELRQASVTESYKTVSYQTDPGAPQKAATTGTVIHPSNVVRTGIDSRAELQFNDNTITRMGANSVFSFDENTQTVNLDRGSILFCKPKTSDTFEIATPAATCSISGTTGFVEYTTPHHHSQDPGTLLLGLVEGKTTITVNGKAYPITGGELLLTTGGSVRIMTFDIVSFLKHAGLIKNFKSQLPNAREIQVAEDRYANLAARGFIEPTSFSFADSSDQIQLQESLVANGGTDQPTYQLGTQVQSFNVQQFNAQMGQGTGGFSNVGSNGIIRGQLVWNVDVDLDLHLILPGNAGNVGFNNSPVVFNGGQATATLDADNVGPAANGPNGERVENIFVTGVPSSGTYSFYGQYYGNTGGVTSPVSYTLTITGNGGKTTQTITGTLSNPGGLSGQTTPTISVGH